MRTIITLVKILVLGSVAAVVFIYSGLYDVAAVTPHAAGTEWVLSTVMDRSVSRHAKGIQAPDLNGAPMIKNGLGDYRELCAVCHGAPGAVPSDISQGLNPPAPYLGASANELTPAELFWVTKNGIKMTGMPAFGATHSDGEIWTVVAFLERLRTLTPDEYRTMSAGASGGAGAAVKKND